MKALAISGYGRTEILMAGILLVLGCRKSVKELSSPGTSTGEEIVTAAILPNAYTFLRGGDIKDYGGARINQNISISPGWEKVKITNINVTNGQCTIG